MCRARLHAAKVRVAERKAAASRFVDVVLSFALRSANRDVSHLRRENQLCNVGSKGIQAWIISDEDSREYNTGDPKRRNDFSILLGNFVSGRELH